MLDFTVLPDVTMCISVVVTHVGEQNLRNLNADFNSFKTSEIRPVQILFNFMLCPCESDTAPKASERS